MIWYKSYFIVQNTKWVATLKNDDFQIQYIIKIFISLIISPHLHSASRTPCSNLRPLNQSYIFHKFSIFEFHFLGKY